MRELKIASFLSKGCGQQKWWDTLAIGIECCYSLIYACLRKLINNMKPHFFFTHASKEFSRFNHQKIGNTFIVYIW